MAVTAKGGIKPGVQVVIGGVEYTAPQLTFGSIRRMREIPAASPTYVHDLMAFVLLESLSRNYDGVDAVWLNETLEGSEVDDAARKELEILRNSGLISQEDKGPGEAAAAA